MWVSQVQKERGREKDWEGRAADCRAALGKSIQRSGDSGKVPSMFCPSLFASQPFSSYSWSSLLHLSQVLAPVLDSCFIQAFAWWGLGLAEHPALTFWVWSLLTSRHKLPWLMIVSFRIFLLFTVWKPYSFNRKCTSSSEFWSFSRLATCSTNSLAILGHHSL
jgi:hypothetical protein